MPGVNTKAQGPLQVFTINNFTLGIVSQRNLSTGGSSSSRVPNALGQVTASANTYGCMAISNGGLLLGPSVRTTTITALQNQKYTSGDYTNAIVTGVIEDVDGTQTYFSVGYAATVSATAHTLRGLYDTGGNNVFNDNDLAVATGYNYASFPFSMLMYNSQFNNYMGLGENANAWGVPITALWTPGTPNSADSMLSNHSRYGYAIPANGRVWFIEQQGLAFNTNLHLVQGISYTDPTTGVSDNITIGGQTTFVDYNSPGSYGAWGIFSSTQSFLVKVAEVGGVIISGDIFNPTVTTVPTIPGTNGMIGQSIMTSIGLVYRSYGNGVWAWNGGAAAQKISTQLDDTVWPEIMTPANPQVLNPFAGLNYFFNCQYYRNYILFDGGFMYDISNNAWWKVPPYIDNNLAHVPWAPTFFNTSPSASGDFSTIYIPLGQTSNFAETFYTFDMSGVTFTPPTGYYHSFFETNPVQLGDDHVVEVQEINIVMQGCGEIFLTCLGIGGATASSNNKVIDTVNGFERLRFNVSFLTDVLVLQIGWTNSDTGTPITPIIESIEVKWTERYPVPVVN